MFVDLFSLDVIIAHMEITTTDEWNNLPLLEQLRRTHWDAYKDAYNVRPWHVDTFGWEEVDFIREIEFLGREIANHAADAADLQGAAE